MERTLTTRANATGSRCGLVNTALTGPRAVPDEARLLAGTSIALTAVMKKPAGNPTIALRCTTEHGVTTLPTFAKITALEVGTVADP